MSGVKDGTREVELQTVGLGVEENESSEEDLRNMEGEGLLGGGGTDKHSDDAGSAPKAKPERPFSQKIMAVSFYWVISISLVFLNKTVMTGDYLKLDAPLFMSWTQFVSTIICCFIMSKLGRIFRLLSFFPPFEYKWHKAKKILPLTCVFLAMIVFNNLCIKYVEVSFYYIARSLTIIFNIVLSYYILGKKTSKAATLCCLMIIAGYLIGCESEVNFSLTGVFFGVGASIFVALNSIFSKQMFTVVNDSTELLMIYNNINAIVLLPIVMLVATDEPARLLTPESYEAMSRPIFWYMIVGTGLMGFLIGYASYLQVQITSPLTHNVSGTAKAAFQTLMAFKIYGNPTNLQNQASVGIVLLASFAYSRVK